MSVFSLFRRKPETDDLNYAHSVALAATSVFDEVRDDLTHANDVLQYVKETSVEEIDKARAAYEAVVRHHTERHDTAHVAQAKNSSVIEKIEALLS